MPLCKYCQAPFTWGKTGDGWVPLIPIGEEGDVPRTYQDENGELRANHRAICVVPGGPAVTVVKLAKAVHPDDILGVAKKPPPDAANEPRAPRKRTRPARKDPLEGLKPIVRRRRKSNAQS